MPWKEVTSLVSRVATMEAMCTKGPSFPRGIPEPRVAVRPTTLATRVLKVRYSLSTTPLRMVFISGMPEPMAWGATTCTKPVAKSTRNTGRMVQAANCR